VRRIADIGFSTLLMPDVQQWQPAPGPTLAVAATLADLRVGTWVYAAPLRMPWSMAWEAHSLSVLTEGRFEMGIGTGRPGIEDELRELGLPVVTPGERLSQVRDTVTSLRELDGPDLYTPVAMAVRGPKSPGHACRHSSGTPQAHPGAAAVTANARQALGPGKILVIGLTAAVDEDPDQARAAARRFVSQTVARPGSPYALNLTRLGYAEERPAPHPRRWSTRSSSGATPSVSRFDLLPFCRWLREGHRAGGG